jgi:hypothetical protein
MALHAGFQYTTNVSLGYSIKRIADGWNYDFSDGTFKNTTPTTLTSELPESTLRPGIYEATLTPTPTSQFPDGDYAVYIYDTVEQAYTGALVSVMRGGDDATVTSGGSGGSDPWSTLLPGSYADGTAGALIGDIASSVGNQSDPWAAMLPGSYADGTAGALIGDMLGNVLSGVTSIVTTALENSGALDDASIQAIVTAILANSFKIDLTEMVPVTGNTPNSVGDCLNAARAQGFGPWTKTGKTLKLYGPDNVTVARNFTLNDVNNPTRRS